MQNKKWFRVRKMGLMPSCWQGWVVIAFYIVSMLMTLDIEVPAARRLYGGLFTIGVIVIAMLKTQPPGKSDG